MTNQSAHPQVDSAPASTDVSDLRKKYDQHWNVWRSSNGSLYATRREDLTPVERDDRLPVAPHRTVFADSAKELIALIEAQYELVAKVTAGRENPLFRAKTTNDDPKPSAR